MTNLEQQMIVLAQRAAPYFFDKQLGSHLALYLGPSLTEETLYSSWRIHSDFDGARRDPLDDSLLVPEREWILPDFVLSAVAEELVFQDVRGQEPRTVLICDRAGRTKPQSGRGPGAASRQPAAEASARLALS